MSADRIERRAYFRITDIIGIHYAVIDSADDFPMEARGDVEMPLLNLLDTIDHDINESINTLWRDNATAAHAIGLLNRKISLLASHILQEDSESRITYEELVASISGCGMAFQCITPLPVDTLLRVAAMLKPSNIALRFTAKVVGCERVAEIPATSYLLRISIDEECTDAREQLVQHVVQRQFANKHLPGSIETAGERPKK